MARSPTAKSKTEVRDALLEGLKKVGATDDQYLSLVDDYLRWWDIHRKFQRDITKRGVTVMQRMSTGGLREVTNPSVKAARDASAHMLAILRELGLSPGHGAETEPELPKL